MHLNPPLSKVWARRGEPARVPAAGRDEKVVVFGGWDYRADRLIWHTAEHKNSGQFLGLLERILQESPAGQQWVLVMDNAPYHRSNKVKEFLAAQSERLEPFWLPSYSPELNLIERVWLYLKENVTNNYFFGQLQVLLQATEQACAQLSSSAETILHVEFKTGKNLPQAA